MKAIVQLQYGSVDALTLSDVPIPALGCDEVLVRARAASVHPDVWHVVTGRPFILRLMGAGFRRPTVPVPGTDVAGVVERVGTDVTAWRPGDAVFGETTRGYAWKNGAAFAEYVAVPQDNLARKPPNVSFEQAASIPSPGLIALMNLRDEARPQAGQRVLVNGAAGGVGSIVVQIAKAAGAEVTGVELAGKLDLVRELGADHSLDAREGFAHSPQRYDLIVDVASNLSFSACARVLTRAGKYVLIGHDHFGAKGGRIMGSVPRLLALAVMTPFTAHLPRPTLAVLPKQNAMEQMRQMLASGALRPPVDRCMPLAEAAEALRYLASGQARGRVLVTM